jgi:hypothetical protein
MKNVSGFHPVLIILMALPLFLSGQPATFTRVFYDMSGTAQMYATIATADQNFLLAGERNDKPMAMKIGQDGNVIWQKTLQLPASRFFCAATTHDGGYLVAGKVMNPAPALEDMLCVKLDATGDTLWSRSVNMGVEDLVFSVKETADHGVIMAGYSDTDGNSAVSIAVVKLDSAGNLLWGRTFYSGSSSNVARGIDQTPDGGYVITGSIANASPYREGLVLMKITADGELSWIKRQAFTTSDYSQGFDVKVVPGGLILNGTSYNAGVGLIKTDLSGNVIWSKGYTWGTTIYYGTPGPKMSTTTTGGFHFVQYLDAWGPGGAARTDSSGNLLWSGSMVVISMSALESSDGGCLVTGNGPIMGVSLSPSDWPQIGIVKTDSSGNSSDCVWGGGYVATPITVTWEVPPVTVASKGNLSVIHPMVVSAFDLDTTSGCVTVLGGVSENPKPNSLVITPNPSDGKFMVRLENPGDGNFNSLEVYNTLGRLVYKSAGEAAPESTVQLIHPAAGLYLVRAVCEGKTYLQRMVVR